MSMRSSHRDNLPMENHSLADTTFVFRYLSNGQLKSMCPSILLSYRSSRPGSSIASSILLSYRDDRSVEPTATSILFRVARAAADYTHTRPNEPNDFIFHQLGETRHPVTKAGTLNDFIFHQLQKILLLATAPNSHKESTDSWRNRMASRNLFDDTRPFCLNFSFALGGQGFSKFLSSVISSVLMLHC